MSKLILGTANFTQPYGIKCNGQVPKEEVEKILETAIIHEIEHIDTSTVYVNPEAYPVKMMRQLKRVKDFYHYTGYIELAHGFDKINDRNWDGASVDTPEEALKAAKMKMKFIQLPFNVFDHSIIDTKYFKLAKRQNITTIARSVFLQGLLLMDNPPIGQEYIKKLDNIIHPYGISRKEAVFLFAYHTIGINYIVIGVDSAKQLSEIVSLTRYYLPDSLYDELYNFGNVPENIKYPWRL
jgi:aryl-alcohol dehydrogenase-like predicted oxidoreductase